jgi:hypothetical protein
MIDISTLDRDKTYVGLSVSDNFVSDAIEKCEIGGDTIPDGTKASHVLGLAYDTDDWYIFEAHLIYKGVRKVKLTDFISEIELSKNTRVYFKEFSLDLASLNYYFNFKKFYPYDIKNIIYRLLDHFPLVSGQDTKNLICSKYISMCELGYNLCYKLNLPYDVVTPAHIQNYVQNNPVILTVCPQKGA